MLQGVVCFVERASRITGVRGISLIGSLTTQKADPKDVDLMVAIGPETDLPALAQAGRKLKGHTQQINKGADIFLSQDGRYLGRTCSYREVFHRQICGKLRCLHERPHLCDTAGLFLLPDTLVSAPPIRLWPEFKAFTQAPLDVMETLGTRMTSF
jgi:hypothetical protein